MSVVHDNLTRKAPNSALPPGNDPDLSSALDDEDILRFEREIARKERLLTEGIRQLQEQVTELKAELDATRRELEQEREDSMRLRRGAMSEAMSEKRDDPEAGPSLLSEALG